MKLEIIVSEHIAAEEMALEAKKQVAIELFKTGKYSTGYCAELCDMNYDEFLLFLSKNKVSIFNQTVEEVMEDSKNS